jgi:short-subunit dehydrogenase
MDSDLLKNRTALVTGASSGLGVDFARELARLGCNLLLVARREDQLNQVAAGIAKQHGVRARPVPLDLALPDAPQQLYDQLRADGESVDVLVNNAGFAYYGEFASVSWEREKAMLDLDILALTHLTKLFLQDMLARNFGYILLVSSIGAYQPSPTYATYSAAKSFVLNFGEALHFELRRSGVGCTVVSPGVTATEFLKVAGQKPTAYQRMAMMKSADVARIGVRSMLARKASVVPGWLNALSVWSNRLLPRSLSALLSYRLMTLD